MTTTQSVHSESSNKKIRIGCASGFYGDSQLAARQLVDDGNIDYLVFDYLAEITMAILAKAKSRDDRAGFAVDFVTVAMKDVDITAKRPVEICNHDHDGSQNHRESGRSPAPQLIGSSSAIASHRQGSSRNKNEHD